MKVMGLVDALLALGDVDNAEDMEVIVSFHRHGTVQDLPVTDVMMLVAPSNKNNRALHIQVDLPE